ncbi:Pimeloyl-ACP methyl ester carboxylesterase [Enhydrobacter aerosaccus]|uniref:Pimeloyl-ACP methyl ester carboxylesterase n=1 Tax=Enhydrobacter aerosaccus TaxID=225324 RepID=A0A1T4T0K6_9HYPH|nr:alpha/beta hydrolase [Enhydrobacter aerosaccus]SKA33942.1 Pimeloyl-ACP methyl ester carboxylesterase [Enhydrobacter aerosaccus]
MPRPTLVLLPGLLNTARLFERQIADLGDVADIVVPELHLYDSIPAMAQAALALTPQRFAVAGFSMGGYVAFEILRQARERVERLALIDTQASPDSPDATARRRGFIDQTRIGRFRGVQPSLLPMIVHPARLKDMDVVQPILDMAQEVGAEGFVREQTAIMARPDSRPLLAQIDIPTVVVVGRQDQMTPLSRSQEMAADIANARLVVLEQCGHMSPLEKPDELNQVLRRWLTS